MVIQAARDFNIDLSESYMIGDSKRDIEAGKNAGCKKSFLLDEYLSLDKLIEKLLKKENI